MARWWIEPLDPPTLDQYAAELITATEYVIRDDARRFENWDCFFAGKAALGLVIDYAIYWDPSAIWQRVRHLADRLRAGLADLPHVTVTDRGRERCGLVTFTHNRQPANAIKAAAAQAGFNVSVSSGSGSFIDFHARGLSAVTRASVHHYSTEDEVDHFTASIGRIPS